jgi:hypothetical protein
MLSTPMRLSLAVASLGLLTLASCKGPSFDGKTRFGEWKGAISVSPGVWSPGQELRVKASLQITKGHLERMAAAGCPVEKVVMLLTAERTFDAGGWMRLASDEGMSTLITPTGLAIEGGNPGAVTDRFGNYPFKSPVDELVELDPSALVTPWDLTTGVFVTKPTLPADLPPGLYRLRVDFGVKCNGRHLDLNAAGFASRHAYDWATYMYSSIFPASGKDVSGADVDATRIQARIPWVLFADHNSNGYRGVVADEDKARFALSPRHIIPDEVVLPLYHRGGDSVVSYSLEPTFPMDGIDERSNIPWDWTRGEMSLEIEAPDGTRTSQPPTPIVGMNEKGPTTGNPAFTSWKPPGYGRYTVRLTGWIADKSGRRYEGGGTYRFWIAKRMTMATATFQGMAYPVGYRYGRDIAFSPAVPADVTIAATLYPNSKYDSDSNPAHTVVSSGKATAGGVFGAAQGMNQLVLDAPGEYHATILATYQEPGPEGHLWVCVMRHAGVVYGADTPIVARGKKLHVGDAWVARAATGREGSRSSLDHIDFPYNSGDVLLIASEGEGANKIEPTLVVERAGEPLEWGWPLAGIGRSNLFIRTSNGYSPHLYPEYITDWQYYYAAAARPGFVPRFLVGESNVFAPYWPTSPNGFGGQIGTGHNGDLPGDIYRLMGGVVMRDRDLAPAYAGYLASAFILPGGTNDNRVIAPGSEDLIGPTGERARFFLVGFRPGMALPEGASWRPVAQVDPVLPATISATLWRLDSSGVPDPASRLDWTGVADAAGSWAGATPTPPLAPGVYRYQLGAIWTDGSGTTFTGKMPGLPDAGGEFYVYTASPPVPSIGFTVDLPGESSFEPDGTLTVSGVSTADRVRYALIMPGAVLDQGEMPVTNGVYQYVVDPVALNRRTPIYDIRSITSGQPEIGRVLHLTFFAEERAPDGTPFWDFRRVIVRGTKVLSAR